MSVRQSGLFFMMLSMGVSCGAPKKQADLLILSDDMAQRADLSSSPDMSVEDQSETMPDQGPEGLSKTCEGDCAKSTLSFNLQNKRSAISRAVYGLSAASTTDSGEVEVYIEAFEGGDKGCPTMSAATPKRTLILSGLKAPLTTTAKTKEDGLFAKLIDYEGTLLEGELFASPEQIKVTAVATNLCIECLEMASSDDDGFVALDLELSFPQGAISGRLYAIHCDSLDAKGP